MKRSLCLLLISNVKKNVEIQMKHIIVRFLSMLFTIFLVFMLCAVGAGTADMKPDIITGDYIYSLANGQACIVGYMGDSYELVIPDQLDGYPVTAIDNGAFAMHESFTAAVVPESILYIGPGTFMYCENLLNIDVAPGNPSYTSVDGVLFDKRQETLIAFPAGRKDAYNIPDGTQIIGYGAFQGCSELTGIIIPDSITSIRDLVFERCWSLAMISIPSSVTEVGRFAFKECYNLTFIIIPESVTSIGDWAFLNCQKLKLVVVENSYARQYMSDYELNGISVMGSIMDRGVELEILTAGEYTYVRANNQAIIIKYSGNGEEVIIPDQLDGYPVIAIGNNAFECSYNLVAATIPDSVVRIYDEAFRECGRLASVSIPKSVVNIGHFVFYACPELNLLVEEGSYAAQFAAAEEIPYWEVL